MEYVANQRLDIRDVKDISTLLEYFHDHLNWNLDLESFEDVEDYLYEFTADDLGLTEEGFVKIESLRQLPPVEDEQQWGVFCVEFATEKFSITALRKILSCLVPKVRNATNMPSGTRKTSCSSASSGKDKIKMRMGGGGDRAY